MTLPATYFDQLYAADRDPWGFESRWYEQRKYDITRACLPQPSYRKGLEIGCSIGVLTAALARRCDALLAVDTSAAAVAVARQRLAGEPHVELREMTVPAEWPDGDFDLIVLSEVGYYFDVANLDALLGRILASLTSDGVLIAVHWRHPVADYPLTGDQVHERIAARESLGRLASHREADFVLDVFGRSPVTSVAQANGLVP